MGFVTGRVRVEPADLDYSVRLAHDAIAGAASADWSARAGTLTWSCRETAEHLVDDLLYYASALAVRARRRLKLWIKLEESASGEEIAQAISAAGAVLGAVVEAAPPGARVLVFDDTEIDPEGYLALGVAETLLHTHDVAEGFAMAFEPRHDVCERVLARLFPDVEPGAENPWTMLRWVTGRVEAPGRAAVGDWKYHAAPVD